MKLYISGGMSGYANYNYDAFMDMANKLRQLGNEVVNPAELAEAGIMSWEEYLKLDIKYLMDCDAIVVLDGWEKSRGATVEVYLGIVLGMKVYNTELKEVNPAKYINKNMLLTFITKKLLT